jgi:hypothetical protein
LVRELHLAKESIMATTTTLTAGLPQQTSSAAEVALIERCVERGIPDRDIARRAMHATLAVLGSRLTDDEAGALACELPGELARIVDRAEYDRDFDAAELYALIAGRTHASSLGDSREQTDVVIRVIGETIADDVRRRLCRALPEPIARRLRRSELDEAPPPPPHPTRTHSQPLTTLASGRPGSRHPLAEAALSEGQTGQTHSVVRSANPHADTKLSSTRGLTQERLGETLAESHGPSPDRPIAEANDDHRGD